MKNRGTYALLTLFFAGLCGLWLADYAKLPTRRDRDRLRNRVLPELVEVKPDDLRSVQILGGSSPLIFERREGNRWQMTRPSNVAADPSMVETLAFNLKELTRKPEADTLEGDLASFGLAPPERTVRLWGPSTDSPLATLELGKISLDRRYVRAVGHEGVEIVDARMLDLAKLAPTRWRDRELFRTPSFEVDAVRIVSPSGELKLRRGSDSWRIIAPIKAPAAETRIDGLIADLGTLRVLDDTRFVADDVRDADLEKYGLKTPTLTIEVQAGRDGKRRPNQSIQVGKPVEGKEGLVYVRRGDQDEVLAIDSRVLKSLGVVPNAYRSPRVADINPARVVRIEVESEDKFREFGVVRSGRNWTISHPNPAPADRPAIEKFLKALSELQTSIYLTPAGAPDSGLDHPSMVLKIWQAPDPSSQADNGSPDPNGELSLSLKIGRRDTGKKVIYAQIEGDSTILALPDSANDFLPRGPLSVRDRLVLTQTPDQVERLAISGAGRKFALQAPVVKLDPITNAPIGWWMVEPVTAPGDAQAVGVLLKLLSNLRADGLVTESPKPEDLKSFGLDQPTATLTWSTYPKFSMVQGLTGPSPVPNPDVKGLENHSLIIGGPVPGPGGRRFARIEGRPLVFTVGAEVLGPVDAEYHDHRILLFDPARVRRVHLGWPDRAFSMTPVEKAGKRDWSVEGAVDAPGFDPAQVGSLVTTTSNLSTARFAQYTGDFPRSSGLTPPRVRVRLEFDDGTPPFEIQVGNPAGNSQFYASTSTDGKGSIFLAPSTLVGPWLRPPRQHDDLPDYPFSP